MQMQVPFSRMETPGGTNFDEHLAHLPIAMAYVPRQMWSQTYKPEAALDRGTIFPALDLPFLAAGGERR
ncbi:MAG: spore coat associated protein CotJA [Oscillospiraceae bacterium]